VCKHLFREIFRTVVLPVIFFYSGAFSTLEALDPGKKLTQYNIRIWNKQSGLPSNSVFSIQQTRDGYLWIGTQEGLVRFDGINFHWYTTKNIPQLKDNTIRALYEDRQGVLWIGTTFGGLTCFREGEFITYPITKYKALYKISAINEDRTGNLWVGSLTRGLTCISKDKFTTYTAKQGLPHDQVWCIAKDAEGELWTATTRGIIKVIKPGVFREYARADLLPDLKTACLYEADTGYLWVGTGNSGLTRWKNDKFTVYGVEAGVPNPIINFLYRDRRKTLWIGTDGGGLTRVWNGIFSTLPGEHGLDSGYVYSIHEDREGSLWVGTLDGGLHQLRDTKFTTYTTREGLTHDYIHTIYERSDGGLWIGTKQGLSQWKNGKMTAETAAGPGLYNQPVTSVYEDRAGNTWFGTMEGIHRYKDGKIDSLTKADGLSVNIITCIHGDRWGNTWIGTRNGLNRYDGKKGDITVFSVEQGLCGNFIECIYLDSRGSLWVGTDAGLNRIKDGAITVIQLVPGAKRSNFVCIYEDKRGVLWFGGDIGLVRWEKSETTLFTVQSGLIENHVYSIMEDDRGTLWLGGRVGISRVSKKELEDFVRGKVHRVHPVLYNEKDGMKSGWCNGSGCKTRDGKLWFPTGKGVTMVDPHQIKPTPPVPDPVIEKIIVDGKTFTIKSFCRGVQGGRFFQKEPPLELTPGKKRLEFYYTVLSFIHPGGIRFKIKLSGYDDDWMEVGTTRNTYYTNLSPGRYTFQVKACNAEGVWNKTGASFSFYMRPYFYQTGWFYFLIGTLVLLGAYSIYRFRVRQMKAREKELGVQVEMRTRDLKARTTELEIAHQNLQHTKDIIEEKNRQLEEQSGKLKELDQVKSRFFANISHEFRTPLTLIMGPLEQMRSQSTDRRQQKKLGLMIRNAQRLLGLINQLLELSKIKSGTMKLRVCRQNIVPFLKGIQAAFEILADNEEVELIFYAEEENILLYFDPERIEMVVSNLLMNALKFTPSGGRVEVSVGKSPPGWVEISVSDTGPGIPGDQVKSIFDHFYQLDGTGSYEDQKKGFGIGLALAKEFIVLHHGEIRVKSEEGRGAQFVIRLPAGNDHMEPGTFVQLSEPAQPVLAGRLASMLELENRELEPGPHEPDGQDTLFDDQTGEETVLVVEDNVDMRQYIKNSLEPGYRVIEAADGREGIDKAQEIIPDLIISDIMMPGVDGYELCRELKNHRETSHVPIILLTAKAAEEDILQGLEIGADDYITKPFSTTILCARVKNLVNLRRHLQQTIEREMKLQPAKMAVSAMDKEFMSELKAVIDKNLSEPGFTVEELSKQLYMSHSNLFRKIKALTGESPRDFIRSYRLKRGAEMLKSKSGNVGDVAFEVGFTSPSYFIRCFKEKFHRLPSSFMVSD
jgi:signal transduction histidine kinase/ligand-binding sensor domain-containing protein/DNA-binding response OmpR family regulator